MYDQQTAEYAEGAVKQLSAEGSSLIVQHSSSGMTQVLEPAALDVCVHDNATLYIIIAGRGTQLMMLKC